MAEKKTIHLKVLTPSKVALDRQVDFVVLRTVDGDMGVLPGHEPYAAMLGGGVLQAYVDKQPVDRLAVLGGVATIRENQVTVLSRMAEAPENIEAELERIRQQRADNVKQDHRSEVEIQRAEMALRRALMKGDLGAIIPEEEPRDSKEESTHEEG